MIEGALSEYFRFLTCDESLMVFNHSSSDGNAMLLILPAEERHWRVAYKNDADASDVTRVTLGKLLDNARNLRVRVTAASCPGWTYTREDLPLNAFICSKLQVPFSVKVMESFYVLRPLPGQRICPQTPLLRELAKVCDDLPEIRARFAIERIAARCDPVLSELVKEDPGVRVREYNFAASGQSPSSRVNRFRWARSFAALWGLRNEPHLRALIDAGQPFIKPAAALLDCSATAIRRLRVIEHSVADLRFRDGQYQDIGIEYLDEEQPGPGSGRHSEWVGTLDVPLLLLDGLADLPVDKLPPPESLTSLNVAIQGGPCRDAHVRSVICSSFYAARLLTEERQGVINPIFPAFRPLLASTKGDWGSVAHQIEDLTRAHLIGIRDFVHILADTLVLPYVLRVNEVCNQAEVEETLLSSARGQLALMLAARWHIGVFLRQSLDWHKSFGVTVGTGGDNWRKDYDWPAWFKPFRASNRVVIRPLCSAAALREEGALVHHCVGRYDRECMTGWTQVFSLRTARGKRLSTLQLSARKTGSGRFRFEEVQNLAAYNNPPPRAAVTAAKELLSALNEDKVRYHVGPPQPRRASADLHVLCGFDHLRDAAWVQARAGALPFLPSDLQRLGPMELGATVTAFRLKQRWEQPELNEADDDHGDFEKRVLRWIR
ncbi:MAG: PcfJ domain-containing protein [Thermoguttaceae bacterium]